MSRYHVIDTISGEIIHQTNRHPLLAPLAARRRTTPRVGLHLKKHLSTYEEGVYTLTIIAGVMIGLCFYYALYM